MMKYDIIIIGAGASGLQLALALTEDRFFDQQRMLLLDHSDKKENDRTWCFWETNIGKWDAIVARKWDEILVANSQVEVTTSIHPFSYKMIRGADFYRYAFDRLSKKIQLDFEKAKVHEINSKTGAVQTDAGSFQGAYVFDSRPRKEMFTGKRPFRFLKQHFVGWFIRTYDPVFNENRVHFMDFRIPQKKNTRFIYLLPSSPYEALVEYTLFSAEELERQAYEDGIREYLKTHYNLTDFEITERESGVIPMTDFPLERAAAGRWIPIGSAGGWTKGSTGFTFKLTEQKVAQLVEQLKKQKLHPKKLINARFRWYDSVLLEVLWKRNEKGGFVFTFLFKRNRVQSLLRFLNEESTFMEELKILWNSPRGIFTKGFISRGLRRLSAIFDRR